MRKLPRTTADPSLRFRMTVRVGGVKWASYQSPVVFVALAARLKSCSFKTLFDAGESPRSLTSSKATADPSTPLRSAQEDSTKRSAKRRMTADAEVTKSNRGSLRFAAG